MTTENKLKLQEIMQLLVLIFIIGLVFSSLGGCSPSTNNRNHYYRLSQEDANNLRYRGHYKVGKPYNIKGKTYKPKEESRYKKTGLASWYGSECGFHGSVTANGDTYNKNLLTAAHKTLPLPSLVKVKNLENGRSLILMVNDRGPYKKGREIDVSEKAAKLLGFHKKGVAKVKVEYLAKETRDFYKEIGLVKKEGSKVKREFANAENCSINCRLKLINLKRKNKSALKSAL